MKINLSHYLLPVVVIGLWQCQTEPYPQGKILYQNFCQSCHMEDGSGLGLEIPPLANADYLKANLEIVPCIIHYGQSDTIVVNGNTYAQPMEGIDKLSAIEITNIINFIGQAWGKQYEPVTLKAGQRMVRKLSARRSQTHQVILF